MRSTAALLLTLLVCVVTAGISHAHPRIFFFPAGLVLPLFGTIVFMAATYRWRDLGSWLALGFGFGSPDDPREATRARRMCRAARSVAMTMGLSSLLIYCIIILTRLDDWHMLAPGLALAFCSPLYALLLGGVLFRSMEEQIRTREEALSAPPIPRDE